jgi:hypothetical protein
MASSGYYTSTLSIISRFVWVLTIACRAWDGSITRFMNLNLISYCSSQLIANFSLGCITDRRVGALLTTNPPSNNKLALIGGVVLGDMSS